jgi:predicted MFS family arabinose efflux permease
MDSLIGSAGALVGPGVSGTIIGMAKTTTAGAVIAYLVDCISYLVSFISLCFIRTPLQSPCQEEPRRPLKQEVLEGLRFAWNDKTLRTLTATSWLLAFLYAPVPLAMIVLAREHLQASAQEIGLVFSLSAIGGIVGATVAERINHRFTIGQIIIGTIALQALVTPVVGLATSTTMMTVGWAIAFMLDPLFSSAASSYRLGRTPDYMQGRAQSIYRLGGFGGEPLGAALGGLLLERVGPRAEILAVAVGVGLCAIAVYFTNLRTLPITSRSDAVR